MKTNSKDQALQNKSQKGYFLKNKVREKWNTALTSAYLKKNKRIANKIPNSWKQIQRIERNNHKWKKKSHQRLKPQVKRSAIIQWSKRTFENKNNPKATITDSDSKKFFDEIFESPTDTGNMLFDIQNIEEESLSMDYLEEDEELEIK